MTLRKLPAGDGGASVALPITPMLDMSFQLLFFFIATFHLPTGMEGQMPLAVTQKEGACGLPSETSLPVRAEAVPDLRSAITIVLKGDGAGQSADGVSALSVAARSGETPLPYSKDLSELRQNLLESARNDGPRPSILVRGDGRVKWRGVVKVMDACREAGLEDVTFGRPADNDPR